jgi:integrase
VFILVRLISFYYFVNQLVISEFAPTVHLYHQSDDFFIAFFSQVRLLGDDFIVLRNTLDTRMKHLSAEGHRVPQKKADIITLEEEERLWAEALGDATPQQLLDTLVYLIGLHFALRGCHEHRNLRFASKPQITLLTDSEGKKYLQYQEDVSKTRQGGLAHRKTKVKVVRAYAHPNPDRCIVRYFEKYCAHRPPNECCKDDAFYLRPLQKPRGEVWFSTQAVGRHALAQVVKRLCGQANIDGHHTNHSLRATAASRLYQETFDEQQICEITGHRSTAVRDYKHTSEAQQKKMSDCIASVKRFTPAAHPRASASVSSSVCGPTASTSVSPTEVLNTHGITININIAK